MFSLLLISVSFDSLHASGQSGTRQNVFVGGYVYEPFIDADGSSGVTFDLIRQLNQIQDVYQFNISVFPSRRRYAQMAQGNMHVIFFESPIWGWTPLAEQYDVTDPIVQVREQMVMRADSARFPRTFGDVAGYRLVLINGFSYNFAGFELDTMQLKRRYDAVFVHNQYQILHMIQTGRAELGIANDMFLSLWRKHNPQAAVSIATGPTPDYDYKLPAIVSNQSPVGKEELTHLLDTLKDRGMLLDIIPEENLIWGGNDR
ncbi:hypothetical protein GCM10017044_14940 [Kordiimonas sediminis]|uniref:Solute-binding protein family 3/N-terminal domain-containing protein n=1 Tax=Kordiimonas sediminis TaxID=1735581 RepID=A0A919E7A5_9PROT|nr:transporter substrate-binding domain-containing protein [Kordiimonas sediminis]GHF21031.1 hypothetical protein GCM10017044_14940 [Kordiimonas sediminis]